MTAVRRVCALTGSRADYGPLLALLRVLARDLRIDLRLLVTGGHLAAGQGMTVDQIVADGFPVDERVDIVLANDTPSAVSTSYGLAVAGIAGALERLDPDLLLILGDRYEAHAAAVAAHLRGLPIAHISGGELSWGSTDDAARHAITKLAHLHFTANDEFRGRVMQMGEPAERVWATGSPSLDTVRTIALLDRDQLAELLGVKLRDPVFALTYHPATSEPDRSLAGARGLLAALDVFADATLVFTGTNVDQRASAIAGHIHEYVMSRLGRAIAVPSLGPRGYLSLVSHAAVVVGNSSSGLVEAPALGTPTVNIGARQKGRPRAESVIDCGEDATAIEEAIRAALSPAHQHRSRTARSPWGDGHAAERIADVLATVDLDAIQMKAFVDLNGDDT